MSMWKRPLLSQRASKDDCSHLISALKDVTTFETTFETPSNAIASHPFSFHVMEALEMKPR